MRALLALFIRSLREDVRARSTYIVRAALVTLVLFFLWTTHDNSRWSGAVGLSFLGKVVSIDLFILSVVGLSYFASAITEEKEGETLGLLCMTNLDALSILLGKSTARLIGALCIIGAQLPFMLVAVTMGGVATRQVYAAFACLLGYAFLLANLGTFWSVVSRKTSGATLGSALSIGGLLVFPWLFYRHQSAAPDSVDIILNQWAALTPFSRVGSIMVTNFAGSIFDWQFLVSVTAGLLFFLAAWRLFDRYADPDHDRPAVGETSPTAQPSGAQRVSSNRATIPALRWKDFHFLAGGQVAAGIKALITICIALFCLNPVHGGGSGSEQLALWSGLFAFFSALFLALCLSLDASRIFRRERDEHTISSLMTLPIEAQDLVWDKLIGCLKTSFAPAIGVALGLVVFGMAAISHFAEHPNGNGEVIYYGRSGIVILILSLLYLPVFIAWLSLRMRWGALPVGGTVWFFGNWIVGFLAAIALKQAAFVLLPLFGMFLIVATWRSIAGKLEQLAAEE